MGIWFDEAYPPDPNPTPGPCRLDVFRWNDLKGHPNPPVEWSWHPFFPKVPLGFLVSHPGHGKSILATQFAVAKAVGLPLYGYPSGDPGGTGLLALEDDQNVVYRRIRAIVEAYGPAWTPVHDRRLNANFRLMVRAPLPILSLSQGNQALHLLGLAMELVTAMKSTEAPANWLGIDTLNAVNGGDENDATASRSIIAAAYSIHDALGCAIYALHHLRKTGIGRQTPALMDRMDPELMRGSSALLGGARAVCQFGWITPSEAAKVDLESDGSQRRYAIFGLTKINDGTPSPWLLLEHSKNAGLWLPVDHGDQILGALRGGNAKEDLGKAEAVLMDIHAGLDRMALMGKHYPDDPKGSEKLKSLMSDMRRRRRWLVQGKMELTNAGIQKVKELKGRQAAENANLGGEESDMWSDSA